MPTRKNTAITLGLQLSFFDEHPTNKRPLPELIALGGTDWAAFALAYVDVSEKRYYAVQDWIKGIAFAKDTNAFWRMLLKRYPELRTRCSELPYNATNGRVYQMDHANAEGLYAITQCMGAKTGIAKKILDYLVKAGVTLDEIRTEQRSVASLKGAAKTLEAALASYDDQGKDKAWQAARAVGIIDRNSFTKALIDHVFDLDPKYHIGNATNTVYKGLWQRDAGKLREEMNLKKSDDLRDHQTMWALHYQGLVEGTVAHYLDKETTVSYYAAKRIIEDVAAVFGVQADQLSKRLGFDLATGKPLLKSGK